MRNVMAVLTVALCVVTASGALSAVNALGALAVGETAAGVAKQGVAVGTSWNYTSQDEANTAALKRCFEYKAAPLAAKECKVVGALKEKQCLAIAMDPKVGTPGVGWAIADDKATAEAQAVANCKVTAGSGRAPFCTVSQADCDGEANKSQ